MECDTAAKVWKGEPVCDRQASRHDTFGQKPVKEPVKEPVKQPVKEPVEGRFKSLLRKYNRLFNMGFRNMSSQ